MAKEGLEQEQRHYPKGIDAGLTKTAKMALGGGMHGLDANQGQSRPYRMETMWDLDGGD